MTYYIVYEYPLDHQFLVEILDINIASSMVQIYQRKRFHLGTNEVELTALFTNRKDANVYLMEHDPHKMQL